MTPYSPQAVLITWGAFSLNGAIAKGTFVKIGRNEDTSSVSVGGDGEATVILNKNKSGRMTLTLMMDSGVNDIVSAQMILFENGAGGILPLLVKDLRGNTLYHSENCWPVKYPEAEYSNEDSTREWVFECDRLDVFVGGAAP